MGSGYFYGDNEQRYYRNAFGDVFIEHNNEWMVFHSLENVVVTGITDTPSKVNAIIGVAGWILEIFTGIATVETGVGVALIINGVVTTGIELTNLIQSFNNGTSIPVNNLGDAVGLAFGGEEGKMWGGVINNVVVALVAVGIYESYADAISAVKESKYFSASTKLYESYQGVDGVVDFIKEYKRNKELQQN